MLLAFEQAERETDRQRQRRLLTFVVVGWRVRRASSWPGALAEISRHALAHDFPPIDPESARVILIEGGPSVLSSYPPDLSAFARKALEKLGVAVWTGSVVSAVEAGRACASGDEVIEAGTILWAAGVSASPLGASLGAPLDRVGRGAGESDLTVPGHPDISVVGDLARSKDASGAWLPGVAQVAIQQARHAAENIGLVLAGQPRRAFSYRNLGNLRRSAATRRWPTCRASAMKGYLAWLFWLFVHILKLIGFRNRLTVMTQWASRT
jgi:NADH dehydrogenase